MTCDFYIETHTINRDPWRVKADQTYGDKWIGHCDLYFPCAVYKGYADQLRPDDEYGRAKGMVGVIVRRSRDKVVEYLKGLDWTKWAKEGIGGRLSITPAIIKRAVVAGGFVD